MKTLDHGRKVTHVFGRQPLRYLQDGYGFDAAERCLGRCNDQGELMQDEAPILTQGAQAAGQDAHMPPAEPASVGDPGSGAPQNHSEGEPATDPAAGQGADLEALDAHYQAKSIKELKALAKSAEIPGASTLNKAALVEALVERANKGEAAA